MQNKGIDSTSDPSDKFEQLRFDGVKFIALYFFKTSGFKVLLTKELAQKISKAGFYIVSIFENASPTTDAYFTSARGTYDAMWAIQRATEATQPKGTPIYFTVDYEGNVPLVKKYFSTLSPAVRAAGYKVGVYGSGLICKTLKEEGLVDATYLSQSRSFPLFEKWKPNANLVQGPEGRLEGLNEDSDTSNPTLGGGGWKI